MPRLYRFLFKWVDWTCGITLPYTTKLGRRLRIWYHNGSGMVLRARSSGDDVHLSDNPTFGVLRHGHNRGIPVIGDRVNMGYGACVLGGVQIGHDGVSAANAVFLNDIPPYPVVVVVPLPSGKNPPKL